MPAWVFDTKDGTAVCFPRTVRGGDRLSVILAIIVYSIVVYAIFFDRKPRRKSPITYRRERAYRRAEKAAARHAALPVIVREARETRRARSQTPESIALPDFVQDVETALVNLEYSRKKAKQAAQRAAGDDFGTRLKTALETLRLPDAKLSSATTAWVLHARNSPDIESRSCRSDLIPE
jgi:hypothetical protein